MADDLRDSLVSKHKMLLGIASACRIFAWIALIVYTLLAIDRCILALQLELPFSFITLSTLLATVVDYLLIASNTLLRGVIYWLLLKGISLGLKMLVEIAGNYRMNLPGGSHG